MKVKCEYCSSFIDDTEDKCPNCGAPNAHMVRSGIGVPKTIEELLAFCQKHKLPLEKMRFFIGIDYREPRAFGIYRETNGDFIVYKNKADGTRAERYRGSDEAYAVNEIYQKLKSEIQLRKGGGSAASDERSRKRWTTRIVSIAITIAVIALLVLICAIVPDTGYYHYNDDYYYYGDGSWFLFDTAQQSWYPQDSVSPELSGHYSDYWSSDDYSADTNTSDFTESEYYSVTDESDWSDDWDDDDFDWDSGSTDWDSDW